MDRWINKTSIIEKRKLVWVRCMQKLSTTSVIILSFFITILIGAVLLMLPVSSASGEMTPFVDALFTATTSVCVTGLVVVTTASHWSLFGHVVILLLIQIGGLGVIAITTTIVLAIGKNISLRERMILGDALNMDSLQGLVTFLKKVFVGTLVVEGIGAIGYMTVFIPEYGWAKGIWYSIFHAVSAFCNAGIDILGESSLIPYVHHIRINVITMSLIILGGIGFVVWWDVLDYAKRQIRKETRKGARLSGLQLHSKIVILTTLVLILGGAGFYLIFEYNNSATIGEFNVWQKCLASLFQSVTTRTAGFAAISQSGMTTPSVILSCVLMFIGGSSQGTAGGVKTGTIAVIFLMVLATVRGQEDITCFNRRISIKTARKSVAVVLISFLASVIALALMFILETGNASDMVFEVYSALGTAGLSRDYTATLGLAGKIVIMGCMFLGRIGPISMVLAFTMRDTQTPMRLPEDSITVG